MKVLDLFSGIGGFALGLERAGMETIAFCEIEEFPRRILKKHWPKVPIAKDIRKLTYDRKTKELKDDGKTIYSGTIDLICGGYPCQGESISGKRLGVEDDRWLWPEMFRLVKETWARWVVGENVANHANMGLDIVLSDLENNSYTARSFDVSSDAAGLPTMERHIWTIATTHNIGCEGGCEIALQNLINIQGKFQGGNQREQRRWNLPEARVCGVGEGVSSRTHRLRALGNAVPPPVVEILGRAIMEIERGLNE